MKQCSKCKGDVERPGQRYCNACHAAYMRQWRVSHPLTEEQRVKDRARSYAGAYKRRGKIEVKPCAKCGSMVKLEMHHPDYGRPLEVEFLCREHHVEHTFTSNPLLTPGSPGA